MEENQDLVALYKTTVAEHKFTIVVFFRGIWCPFCQAYMQDWSGLASEIRAQGGEIFAVTGEMKRADQNGVAKKAWNLQFDEHIDKGLRLQAHLSELNLVKVALTDDSRYVEKLLQPAVLIVDREGKVLYSWAINPAKMNLGGATDRPVAKQVWAQTYQLLENTITEINHSDIKHTNFRDNPLFRRCVLL